MNSAIVRHSTSTILARCRHTIIATGLLCWLAAPQLTVAATTPAVSTPAITSTAVTTNSSSSAKTISQRSSTPYPTVDELQSIAHQLKLSEHPSWLRLLHYHQLKSQPDIRLSHVDDARFFLASTGRHNSQAELDASIEILLWSATTPIEPSQQAGEQPNQQKEQQKEQQKDQQKDQQNDQQDNHQKDQLANQQLVQQKDLADLNYPECRFVERAAWLRTHLNLPPQPVPDYCESYYNWHNEINAHSIALIFPAAYLNSPSSMFGHTLLRLDPEFVESGSSWLSYSLNFSADVGNDAESSMSYAFKGITGAYPGKFHVTPYFERLQTYGAIENRDIWEYKLDLNPQEVSRLVNHAWELTDITFDYYFFLENCSFRLLELLEYARPSLDLTAQFKFTAIPADTVKSVVNADLVSSVKYRPSLGAELQASVNKIAVAEQHWIYKLQQQPANADASEFQALPQSTQQQIVTAANQLLTYRSRRSDMTPDIARARFQMLQLINSYPASDKSDIVTPARPDSGHETTLVSLAAGKEDQLDYAEASLRLSYHDLLDKDTGYLRGGAITLGNIRARRYQDGNTRLQAFDIVSLRSVGSRYALFKSLSWGVDVGFTRDSLLENDRMSFRVKGLFGRSMRVSDNALAYGLIGPSVNLFRQASRTAYINGHLTAGILHHHKFGTSQLEFNADALQNTSARWQMKLAHNLPLSNNHALRGQYSRVRQQQATVNRFSLEYRFYF